MSKAPPGSYPKQGVGYPTQQPAYPTQPQPMQYPLQGQFASAAAGGQMYGVPPPPYSEMPISGHAPQQAPSGMYNPQLQMQQYPGMTAGGHYPRQQYPVGQYPAQGPPQQLVHGAFDPGARFGPGSSVNIPPPPPGYAPNTAQALASQGQPVNVQQRQAGWFSGGTGGGYTFW
ncbi:DAZ-associated protein 2-like [Pocillopora verrucosa]|uniref:DAZ-associated protein 2-like n=1 Tax=Pocillopora verrucosa TaxID=203993 RepID=UPI002797438C|nr:DAZ-associated protein 2-like [Pocillopora verrucosa]